VYHPTTHDSGGQGRLFLKKNENRIKKPPPLTNREKRKEKKEKKKKNCISNYNPIVDG